VCGLGFDDSGVGGEECGLGFDGLLPLGLSVVRAGFSGIWRCAVVDFVAFQEVGCVYLFICFWHPGRGEPRGLRGFCACVRVCCFFLSGFLKDWVAVALLVDLLLIHRERIDCVVSRCCRLMKS